jgi:hypothetical protein
MSTYAINSNDTPIGKEPSFMMSIENRINDAWLRLMENNTELRGRINDVFGPTADKLQDPSPEKQRDAICHADAINRRIEELFNEIDHYRAELNRLSKL